MDDARRNGMVGLRLPIAVRTALTRVTLLLLLLLDSTSRSVLVHLLCD